MLFVRDTMDNYKLNRPNSYMKHSYTHGLQPVAMHCTFHFPCRPQHFIAPRKLICNTQSMYSFLKAKLSYYIGVERYDILQAV